MSETTGGTLVSTGAAARALGIDRSTLNRWATSGLVTPANRTAGGHMRWNLERLQRELDALSAADRE